MNSNLIIDLRAVCHNYKEIKKIVATKVVCAASVKANCYGLGLKEIFITLFNSDCRDFFVANIKEGIELRDLAKNHCDDQEQQNINIYILHGPTNLNEIMTAKYYQLNFVINSLSQLQMIQQNDKYDLPFIIHLDSGINRLGLNLSDLNYIKEYVDRKRISYIMSHLSCSEEERNEENKRQLTYLHHSLQLLPKIKVSLANSGGIFLGKDYHFDMIRPGIALYGSISSSNYSHLFKPVVTLRCKILQKKQMERDGYVGYSNTYKINKGEKLIIVEGGYADGLPRSLGNNGFVEVSNNCLLQNKIRLSDNFQLPIAGNISMDLTTIDASTLPNEVFDNVGYVEFINQNITIDDIAKSANTISYEILTRLGTRYQREYIR